MIEEKWWCATHKRPATYINRRNQHTCEPGLGGILIPCQAIKVTELPEKENEKFSHSS